MIGKMSKVSWVAFAFSIAFVVIAAYEMITKQPLTIGCGRAFLIDLIAAVGFTIILGLESLKE